jgi:hypothetical protein
VPVSRQHLYTGGVMEPSKAEVDEVLKRWDATAPAMQRLIVVRLLEKLCRYKDALQEIAGRGPEGWAARAAGKALEEG